MLWFILWYILRYMLRNTGETGNSDKFQFYMMSSFRICRFLRFPASLFRDFFRIFGINPEFFYFYFLDFLLPSIKATEPQIISNDIIECGKPVDISLRNRIILGTEVEHGNYPW